jgi:signal transduction histidine kinase/HD-like signal output (HDOD) protein
MTATQPLQSAGAGPISPGQVEMLLSQIETLPTLPAVASRLLEMTLDDRRGAGDVAVLVASDQTLSARILSVVRKANIGADVQTVDRAVVLLGCDAVRSLVLGVQIFEMFKHRTEQAGDRFDRAGLWRHSLAVGCAARLITEHRMANLARSRAARMGWPLPRPEDAFICGLLHDLGKVVFDACFPKSYERVIERVETRRADIIETERDVFGIDHTVAGHRLAQHWKLPQAVAECIWLHHHAPDSTPTRIGFPDHVLIVQAADRLVRQMRIGYSGNYAADDQPGQWEDALGLTDQAIEQVKLALPQTIELRAELLGLDQITSTELLQESITRTNAELARVNAELLLANRTLQQRSRTLDALLVLGEATTPDTAHEAIAEGMLEAAHLLVGSDAVGVVIGSCTRQITIAATLSGADAAPRVELLPASLLAGVAAAPGGARRCLAEKVLPAAVLDRLAASLPQGPLCCWPVGGQSRAVGWILAVGDVPEDLDASIAILGNAAGSLLAAAESQVAARRLTEELTEMNRRLVNSQSESARMRSLAMVGEMAAGAAHELNNPLAVISGRAQLLARDALTEPLKRTADLIAEHAHRASDIVTELMEFAKPSSPEPKRWALAGLLEQIRRDWVDRNVFQPEQFVLALSDDLPEVYADVAQLRLLFDELIRNAVQAMPDGSTRRLSVNCRGDVADDLVVIKVEDNGCGMPPEVLERAMDPFFSHRPAGRGRGLGLSRAARYAEINHGRIRLLSRVKEGTAVIVELPAAAQE